MSPHELPIAVKLDGQDMPQADKPAAFSFMPADAKTLVHCPKCGRFVLRGTLVGWLQVVCGQRQCRASFVVAISENGAVTINVLAAATT